MEIVFIRHGQTDLNKSGRIQGAAIDAELNEAGRRTAKAAAAHFDASDFDAVFVSPMKRAVETAEIFTKGQKKLQRDRRLLELDYGDWDGQLLADMIKKYPDAIDPWGKANQHYIKYAKNGESIAHLEERCASFFDEVLSKYPDGKVLVVAHGTLIREMAAHLVAGGKMDAFQTMANCGLAKFSCRKGINRLVYYNRVLA